MAAAIAALAVIAASRPGWWALSLVALVPLLVVAGRSSPTRAFLYGCLFGLLLYGIGFHWLFPTAARLQHSSILSIAPFVAAVIGLQAGQYGLAALAAALLLRQPEHRSGYLSGCASAGAVAAAWVLLEWGFPKVLPWTIGGFLVRSAVLRQSADLWGAYGLGFLLVCVNALVAQAALSWEPARVRSIQYCASAVVLLVLAMAYGAGRMSDAEMGTPMTLAVVQGGTLDDDRGDPVDAAAWSRYAEPSRALRDRGVDLFVWPESVLRIYLRGNPPLQQRLAGLVGELGHPLILGALDSDADQGGELNSAYLVRAHAAPDSTFGRDAAPPRLSIYHKEVLVPFAEYVPGAQWFPWLRHWRTTGAFVAGTDRSVFRWYDGSSASTERVAAPSICFEAILPGWFNSMVRDGAEVLINITDDSWLADGDAAELHLQMSRLRAVETRRWMVRASGSGVSAVIDPSGAVIASLPYGEAGTLVQRIERSRTITPYVRWGDWMIAASALLLTACLARLARARSRRQSGSPTARRRRNASVSEGGRGRRSRPYGAAELVGPAVPAGTTG